MLQNQIITVQVLKSAAEEAHLQTEQNTAKSKSFGQRRWYARYFFSHLQQLFFNLLSPATSVYVLELQDCQLKQNTSNSREEIVALWEKKKKQTPNESYYNAYTQKLAWSSMYSSGHWGGCWF